jgi:two-component system cell cycle response regulator CtrA
VLLVTGLDTSLRYLASALSPAGAVIDQALGYEDAIVVGRLCDHGLIVIDRTLPEAEAVDAIRRIRTAGVGTPLIWLCGDATPARRAAALDLGADDCVGPVLDATELLARARAAIRRGGGHPAGTLSVGDLTLDMAAHTAAYEGRRLRLTGKEFRILELLALKKGVMVGRAAIMNYLYGGPDEPGAKVIDVHICRLRRKLGRVAPRNTLLRTVRGLGFVLSASGAPAPVERIAA